MTKRKLKLLLIILVAALLPARAFAVGNLKAGPFNVHPLLLTFGVIYSDNVFRTPSNKKKDTGFLIIPGILFETPRDERKLYFRYEIPVEKWLKLDSQDAVGHSIEGLAHFDLASGWMIEADDKYLYSHDDPGTNVGIELDFFKQNTAHAALGYKFADLYKVRADFRHGLLDYSDADNHFRDHNYLAYSGTFLYQVLPKTSVLFETAYTDTKFDESGALDSSELDFLLGITWDITGKSTGTAKFGYGMKDFEASGLEDFDGFIMSAEIKHNIDKWTSFFLEAVRVVNETNTRGANYFTTTGFSGNAKHMFTQKIGIALNLSYGREEYSNPIIISGVQNNRKDDTWRIGTDLIYNIQEWLGVKGSYLYSSRSSSFDVLDYTENRFSFQIFTIL